MMLGSRKRTEGAGDGWTTIRRRSIQKKAERNVTGERQAARERHPRIYRLAYRIDRAIKYSGRRYQCNVCQYRFRAWLQREQREWLKLCPMCKSHPRMRLMIFWLQRESDLLEEPRDIAHFAAEPVFSDIVRKAARGRRYVRIDIQSSLSDVHADICALPFRAAEFDAIICNHVLEHVPDDRAAMLELRRILRPGGTAILMVPFHPDRETFEDPSVVDPEQRTELFGQFDHVRLYGGDYLDRLREAGFDVDCDLYWKSLGEEVAVRYGLQRDEYLIVGRTRD
jgi:SAM-dependent methyltransferase